MRVIFACLASLLLIASGTSTQRVVSVPLLARLSVDDPDLYVAVGVLDPHVAEITNRYLLLADRPFHGNIDWRGGGPDWTILAPGPTSVLDVSATQLSQVESGIVALGFTEGAVHGWIVSAPVVSVFDREHKDIRSLRIGEILIDLGPMSQAATEITHFTQGSGARLRRIETLAGVHLAFSIGLFYRPNCDLVASRTQAMLDVRAREAKAAFENAIGMHLRFIDAEPFPDSRMLCPDVRAVTIVATGGWIPPKLFASYGDRYIVGSARYEMDAIVPHVTATIPPGGSIELRQPSLEVEPTVAPSTGRYVTATTALTVNMQPAISLLSFKYQAIAPSQIVGQIAKLASIGVAADAVFVDRPTGDEMRVWIRFAPHTNERAKQIADVMQVGAEEEPFLALFTADCSGPALAVAAALGRDRERAMRSARLLHSDLGPPLSIDITRDDIGNATCGFTSESTTEQLARSVLASEPFPPYPTPMIARFPIFVDATWSLSEKLGATPAGRDRP